MDNKIIIYKSKKIAMFMTIGSFVIALGGVLFLQYTDNNVIGWTFIILASLCLIFGVSSLFDRKPYIVLTESGITEMTNIREEIEWNAIIQADDFLFRGQYFVRMLVDRNYKPAMLQPTWFYRLDRIYGKSGMKAFFLRTNYLEVSALRLARFINKMAKADAAGRIKLLSQWK